MLTQATLRGALGGERLTQESKLVASGGGTGRGRTWQEADTVCVEGELRPARGCARQGEGCTNVFEDRGREARGRRPRESSQVHADQPPSLERGPPAARQDRQGGEWEGADLSRGRKAEGAGRRPGQAGVRGVTSHPLLPPRCQKGSFMCILEQHVGISKQSLARKAR